MKFWLVAVPYSFLVVGAWFGIWLALNLLFLLINSMLIYGTAKVLLKMCDQTHLKSLISPGGEGGGGEVGRSAPNVLKGPKYAGSSLKHLDSTT